MWLVSYFYSVSPRNQYRFYPETLTMVHIPNDMRYNLLIPNQFWIITFINFKGWSNINNIFYRNFPPWGVPILVVNINGFLDIILKTDAIIVRLVSILWFDLVHNLRFLLEDVVNPPLELRFIMYFCFDPIIQKSLHDMNALNILFLFLNRL